MIGTQQALQGRFATPSVFIAPLRGVPRARCAQMGVAYAVAMFAWPLVYLRSTAAARRPCRRR